MPGIAVLIVAAGSGARLGGVPKQYRVLGGTSVLARSVTAFASRQDIAHIQIVIGNGQEALYAGSGAGDGLPPPVTGGATRQESVRRGLDALAAYAPDIVLIHDAARPLIPQQVIDGVIAALGVAAAATPAMAMVDSLRRGVTHIEEELSRENIHAVQTPQGFHFDKILAAHHGALGAHTDDASIARSFGLEVALTPGHVDNFKITVDADLHRAERIVMANHTPRTGTGFDVHRFGAGDHVWLCGVKIPHDKGVIAHSDGDVALHALTDALLGTISAGDIGLHFPPSDDRWKNAASREFLVHGAQLVRSQRGIIQHLDITLICERPKITPHREAMRATIADILLIDISRVSVKATTSEGLGFTGRGEGIAAQALATVLLP